MRGAVRRRRTRCRAPAARRPGSSEDTRRTPPSPLAACTPALSLALALDVGTVCTVLGGLHMRPCAARHPGHPTAHRAPMRITYDTRAQSRPLGRRRPATQGAHTRHTTRPAEKRQQERQETKESRKLHGRPRPSSPCNRRKRRRVYKQDEGTAPSRLQSHPHRHCRRSIQQHPAAMEQLLVIGCPHRERCVCSRRCGSLDSIRSGSDQKISSSGHFWLLVQPLTFRLRPRYSHPLTS